MSARTAWEAALRGARLTTAERLVAGQLGAFVTRPTGALIDPRVLASWCCLPLPVVLAALDALAARRLIVMRADGGVVLNPRGVGA
jgi:hypothetical protein